MCYSSFFTIRSGDQNIKFLLNSFKHNTFFFFFSGQHFNIITHLISFCWKYSQHVCEQWHRRYNNIPYSYDSSLSDGVRRVAFPYKLTPLAFFTINNIVLCFLHFSTETPWPTSSWCSSAITCRPAETSGTTWPVYFEAQGRLSSPRATWPRSKCTTRRSVRFRRILL